MSISEMNVHLFLFDWFLLLSWDPEVGIFLVCRWKYFITTERDTPSYKQSDIYFALTINSAQEIQQAGFLSKHLLPVTQLLNHVNAKIKLNPLSFDQAPGTLYPNAFKTSNNIAQTNVLCWHAYKQTEAAASGLNIKVLWGFNDRLNLGRGCGAWGQK